LKLIFFCTPKKKNCFLLIKVKISLGINFDI